jgi:hypothetical protein
MFDVPQRECQSIAEKKENEKPPKLRQGGVAGEIERLSQAGGDGLDRSQGYLRRVGFEPTVMCGGLKTHSTI